MHEAVVDALNVTGLAAVILTCFARRTWLRWTGAALAVAAQIVRAVYEHDAGFALALVIASAVGVLVWLALLGWRAAKRR